MKKNRNIRTEDSTRRENAQRVPDKQAISARAYDLWEREGSPHGRHEEHWHRARRELGADAGDDAERIPRSSED